MKIKSQVLEIMVLVFVSAFVGFLSYLAMDNIAGATIIAWIVAEVSVSIFTAGRKLAVWIVNRILAIFIAALMVGWFVPGAEERIGISAVVAGIGCALLPALKVLNKWVQKLSYNDAVGQKQIT